MPIVGGLDIHRKQITFGYLDTVPGEVRRGQIRITKVSTVTGEPGHDLDDGDDCRGPHVEGRRSQEGSGSPAGWDDEIPPATAAP